MRQLAIEKQASWPEYGDMSMNWTSRLARPLGRIFQPAERIPPSSSTATPNASLRELELIRIRFPHHA